MRTHHDLSGCDSYSFNCRRTHARAPATALYSKLQANKELRAMLNIGAKQSAPDVTQLSDAKLIAQLAAQAKELGIEIDLSYSFAQKPKPDGDSG